MSDLPIEEDVVHEGQEAYRVGMSFNECPYPFATQPFERKWWQKGYRIAENED